MNEQCMTQKLDWVGSEVLCGVSDIACTKVWSMLGFQDKFSLLFIQYTLQITMWFLRDVHT